MQIGGSACSRRAGGKTPQHRAALARQRLVGILRGCLESGTVYSRCTARAHHRSITGHIPRVHRSVVRGYGLLPRRFTSLRQRRARENDLF
jgi:hypothetical protein